MDNQNNVDVQQDGKNYLKKVIVFILVILVAIAVFFDFLGKISKPSGTATLNWNANTESDLAGYKIYYGASARTGDCPLTGGYSEKINIGKTNTPDKPTYKIENLEVGKTYYFSITSYDNSGNESCFSPEMLKTFVN
ncbi:MAG: fibronectin type III domain-containing protein [Patescibacteria group bacterium]